jgi:hypothetical protein
MEYRLLAIKSVGQSHIWNDNMRLENLAVIKITQQVFGGGMTTGV